MFLNAILYGPLEATDNLQLQSALVNASALRLSVRSSGRPASSMKTTGHRSWDSSQAWSMLNGSMLNFWCFRISMSPIIIYTYYIIHSYIKVSVEIRRYIVEIEGPLSRKCVDFEQSAKWTVLSSLRWVAPLPCLSRKLSLFNSNATSTNATLNTLKQSLGNSPNSTDLIQ